MAAYRPPAKPRGLLKWGFNLPIALYRARLGWLAGHRFLLLTHRGRKTGKLRQTVLEVVRFDAATRESVVLSAYGEQVDWYQNMLARPTIEVQTGRMRSTPQYRLLDANERFAALQTYQRRYRRRFRQSCAFLATPMLAQRPDCARSRSPCWSSPFVRRRHVPFTLQAALASCGSFPPT